VISAIVLAAGKAKRMEAPKLFLPLRGKPMLQWVLESVLATRVSEVICVVRDLAAVRAYISVADHRLSWLVNERADTGQSSSVTSGLWAIDPKADAALFVDGDQPMLSSQLINALFDRFNRVSAPIIAPIFQGQVRIPALFRREIFPELLKLEGDRGGRAVIEKYQDRLEPVQWNEEAPFMDIDDQKDYERIKMLA
jgi:molybdenum cofactor cytidylyltransferase